MIYPARMLFNLIPYSSSGIQHDHYAAPAACWQIGVLLMQEGRYDTAAKKLETARYK